MVKLAGNSARSTEPRLPNYIGDIIVTTGVFDSEVTTVIAPFDDYTSSGCGALVVVAPSCRMSLARIKVRNSSFPLDSYSISFIFKAKLTDQYQAIVV